MLFMLLENVCAVSGADTSPQQENEGTLFLRMILFVAILTVSSKICIIFIL